MNEGMEQLEQLYRETGPALLAFFRHQPALAGAAEDLLQDTFVRALQHRERLDGAVSRRAYLFGIARHVGLDALRRRKLLQGEAGHGEEPREDARLESMRAAITELPGPQRETLMLKLQHELSYEEIAEVLAIPVGTVRSRLHHAVLQLRQIMTGSNHDEN